MLAAKLTEKQRAYALGRAAGLRPVDAAARAKYGGTRATLSRRALKLDKHPGVAAEIERLLNPDAEAPGEAEDDTRRGMVWVSNGRGPERTDGFDPEKIPSETGPLEGPFRPQPGPQTAFAECEADIAFYGGAAGGGKSFGAVFELGKWSHVPNFRGIIFRRIVKDLRGLWDIASQMYPDSGGRSREGNTRDWRWPSGAKVEFDHMQRESHRFNHQGQEYALVVFDEITHFTQSQFWYLVSRLRSTCGVNPYLRATCNPDPDSFVADMVAWYIGEDGYPILERSGVVRWFVRPDDDLVWFASREEAEAAYPDEAPLSFTFIAARLDDNEALTQADPGYRGKVQAQGRVYRARLLGDGKRGGNWKVRDGAGLVFSRDDFVLADEPPSRVIATVRAWDKASSVPTAKHPDPDWTRGVRVSLCEGGELWIDDVVSLRARPTEVLAKMRETAESDGIFVTQVIWKDTGQAGVVDVETTEDALGEFVVEVVDSHGSDTTAVSNAQHRSSRAKRAFAKAWAPLVNKNRVHALRGAGWLKALLAEADGFPDAVHDDIIDAISAAWQVLSRITKASNTVQSGGRSAVTRSLRRKRYT